MELFSIRIQRTFQLVSTSKAVFIAFLAAYYSSDTFPLRPQEMSVDCFIIAFLVHTVPLPDNPA